MEPVEKEVENGSIQDFERIDTVIEYGRCWTPITRLVAQDCCQPGTNAYHYATRTSYIAGIICLVFTAIVVTYFSCLGISAAIFRDDRPSFFWIVGPLLVFSIAYTILYLTVRYFHVSGE